MTNGTKASQAASEVGARIARARKERGLSGRAVATKCGMSQSAICRYELGERSVSIAVAARLADVLQISPSVLAFGSAE